MPARDEDVPAGMSDRVEIGTRRFVLKELTVDDVSERYLDWMQDGRAKKFISYASESRTLSDLREYILERADRDDVLFLGIFERTRALHIGNIKFEPVNSDVGFAIVGILIGDPEFRGKEVTKEALHASARWLKSRRNIRKILLRVSKNNESAVRAYEKMGFEVCDTPLIGEPVPNTVVMVLSV